MIETEFERKFREYLLERKAKDEIDMKRNCLNFIRLVKKLNEEISKRNDSGAG